MRLPSALLLAFAVACRYPNADTLLDADEDGFTADVDCDDSDGDVGVSITFYTDADGDGVGTDDGETQEACTAPDGFGVGTDDCDDADADRFPGNTEVTGDGVDQDCSGTDAVDCFVDADKDGWGSVTTIVAADGSCDTADGEADNDDDCADSDDARFPGATEIVGDGIDQNCDGLDTAPCYTDADGDGFGDPLETIDTTDCSGANQSDNGDDCDDTRNTVSPGATEACDGLPSDCDDWTGPTTPGAPPATEVDDDDDTFVECTFAPGVTPANWGNDETIPVAGGDDCSDTHATVHPGASEVCDGFPSDCDDWTDATTPGARPANEVDDDDDGYVECTFASGITNANWGNSESPAVTGGGDCNDVLASSGAVQFPGAPDRCDGLDNDCAGGLEANEFDVDNDTFVGCTFASGVNATNWPNNETPDVAGDRDCDDAVARTFFGAPEFCDGLDNNCNLSLADEDGRVSFESSGGTWTDQTPTSVRQTYTLATSGTVWFCKGTYKVRGNITAATISLIGRYGAATTILSGASSGGTPTDRIVDLETGAPGTPTLTLQGLTFLDGFVTSANGGAVRLEKAATVTITDCVFKDNEADLNGGAIFMTGGTLSMTGSTVGAVDHPNLADNGAGLAVNGGSVTLTDTDFVANEASITGSGNNTVRAVAGGAILFGAGGTLAITGGTFDANTVSTAIASGNDTSGTSTGGAIHFVGGTLTIDGTTFSGNQAISAQLAGDRSTQSSRGGAIHVVDGTVDIDGATFDGNSSLATALDNNNPTTANATGGAIHVVAGTVHLDDTTFDTNVVVGTSYDSDTNPPNNLLNPHGEGGALYVASGTVTLGEDAPVTFTTGAASQSGGAIYMYDGTVSLIGSFVDANTASGGSGEGGGGIAMREGSLTLDNTDVTANIAANNDGGGLLLVDDTTNTPIVALTTGSTVSGNEAFDWGGGIACHSACTVTATSSFVTGNTSDEGGGVHLSESGASFTCTNGGVTHNEATGVSSSASVGLGGGLQLHVTGTSVVSTSCDWGADGGGTDNTPSDVGSNNGSTAIQKEAGAGATFTCTYGAACP